MRERGSRRGVRPPSEKESGVTFRIAHDRGSPVAEATRGPRAGSGSSLRLRPRRHPPTFSPLPPPQARMIVVDVGAVEALALEERLRHLVQDLEVVLQQALRALVRLEDDAADLVVDLERGALGVVGGLREVAAEEDLLFLLAEGQRAELLAHAPLADHLAGELGRALDVVAGAGGHVTEDELLGDAAAEEDREVVLEELAGRTCAGRRAAAAA